VINKFGCKFHKHNNIFGNHHWQSTPMKEKTNERKTTLCFSVLAAEMIKYIRTIEE